MVAVVGPVVVVVFAHVANCFAGCNGSYSKGLLDWVAPEGFDSCDSHLRLHLASFVVVAVVLTMNGRRLIDKDQAGTIEAAPVVVVVVAAEAGPVVGLVAGTSQTGPTNTLMSYRS